jgi:phosphotransferase system  glucose/maltose/N-acetylglucosamine-specific IIC component
MSSQYPQVTTRPMPRPAASAMSPAVDRRARLVLRRLDPWSVLKFSVVFYFCLMLVSLLVFAVIWFVLVNMGVFASLTEFAGIFNFEVSFPAGTVFRWYTFIGLLGVVVWSIVTVLLTLLFNLVNDVTGGIEVVRAEREQRYSGS